MFEEWIYYFLKSSLNSYSKTSKNIGKSIPGLTKNFFVLFIDGTLTSTTSRSHYQQ